MPFPTTLRHRCALIVFGLAGLAGFAAVSQSGQQPTGKQNAGQQQPAGQQKPADQQPAAPTTQNGAPPKADSIAETKNPAEAAPSAASAAKPQAGDAGSSDADRKKQISEESARLLKLATELKSEVDKTTKDTLSLGVIRKAEEIEKLAHAVKEKANAAPQ